MRVGLLTILVFLAAGCGDAGPGAPDEDGLQLATVGLLGDLPPAEKTAVVTLYADGALVVNGKPCSWESLSERLDELTKPPEPKAPKRKVLKATMVAEVLEEDLEEVEETHEGTDQVHEQEIVAEEPVIQNAEITEEGVDLAGGAMKDVTEYTVEQIVPLLTPGPRSPEPKDDDGVSNADVLLRVDRRVPWAVVNKLLWVLVDPRLLITRTFYSVSGRDGGGEGAVAVFLPRDGNLCGRKQFVNADIATAKLTVKTGAGESDAGTLADALLARKAAPDELLSVSIAAPPEAPFEYVLTAVDAALRAGALNVLFDGTRMPETSVAELCAAAAKPGPFHLEVRGRALTLRPDRAPVGPGRRSGYVGTTNFLPLDEELEEPILKDEDLDSQDEDSDQPFGK